MISSQAGPNENDTEPATDAVLINARYATLFAHSKLYHQLYQYEASAYGVSRPSKVEGA